MVLTEIAIPHRDDKLAAEPARRAFAPPFGLRLGEAYAVLAAAEALSGQGAEAAAGSAVVRERNPARPDAASRT